MLKYSSPEMQGALLKLLNVFLSCKGRGDKLDSSNSPIFVTSCLGKLFCSIQMKCEISLMNAPSWVKI